MNKAAQILGVLFVFAVAACGKAGGIEGKWQDDTGSKRFEFMSDGTATLSQTGGEIQTAAGKWSNASDGRILIQFNSMFGTVAAYAHFEGSDLVMDDRPTPTHLHRVS